MPGCQWENKQRRTKIADDRRATRFAKHKVLLSCVRSRRLLSTAIALPYKVCSNRCHGRVDGSIVYPCTSVHVSRTRFGACPRELIQTICTSLSLMLENSITPVTRSRQRPHVEQSSMTDLQALLSRNIDCVVHAHESKLCCTRDLPTFHLDSFLTLECCTRQNKLSMPNNSI